MTVVQSEKDLPNRILLSPDYQKGVRGVAYEGRVWLVADNIPEGQEAGIALHEIGAHIGFDRLEREGKLNRKELADQVRAWSKENDMRGEAARIALAKGKDSNDEIIAYMTEELVNRGVRPVSFRPASTWLRRVVDAFERVLAKLGIKKDISGQELVDLAFGAAHIELGAPTGFRPGAPRFSTGSTVLDAAVMRRSEALTREGDLPLHKQFLKAWSSGSPNGFVSDLARKFEVSVVDNTASVKRKLKDVGLNDPVIDLAFASKSADTTITSMLTGALEFDNNMRTFRAGTGPSIKTVHEEVQNIAAKIGGDKKEAFINAARVFDLGSIVLRERSLPQEQRNKFKFAPEDIKAGEEALRIYGAEIRAGMDAWTTYKNGMLDAGLKAGRFSAEDVAAWKEAPDYVPWHRVLDDAKMGYETKSSAKQFFRGLQDSGKVKDLMGGDVDKRPIGDILNNMEQLSFWLGNATIKNHAGNSVVDALLQLDARRVGSPNASGVDKSRVVKTYRNGAETFYEMGDPLDVHAFMGVEEVTGPWVKFFAKGGNLLRQGTTLMPGFVVNQLFQDAFRATAYSGAKSPFAVGAKVFSEFGNELRGDNLTKLFASYGIIGRPDFIFEDEKSRIRSELDETKTGVRRVASAGFKALDRLTRASDAAQRRAVYKQTLKETGDERLALYKAIEIINFQNRGTNQAIATIRKVAPFTNAYIQGMAIALRAMGGSGITLEERTVAMRAFYATAIKIGALSLLYSMIVSDDDEYQQMPDYMKMSGFMIPGTRQMTKDTFGFDPGGNIRIPSPVDLVGLLFKIVPETAYNYVISQGTANEVDNTKFLRQMSTATINAISSPNAVPQAIKPVAELWANKSFFTGNPILGRGLQNLDRNLQYTSSTTEAAKAMATWIPLAPVQIDHLMRGIFGTAGGTAMFAASAVVDAAAPGQRANIRLNEVPQVRTFLTGKSTAGMKEDFYEMREKVVEVSNTVNRLKTRDPERLKTYLDENKELYKLHKSGVINKIDQALGKLRDYRERIANDKEMSGEDKRRIFDDVEKKEVELLTKVNLSKLRNLGGL